MKILKPILTQAPLLACSTSRRRASMPAFSRASHQRTCSKRGWRSAGRGTYTGGFATAALGLAMHFTMALTVATIFYALSHRFSLPRNLLGVVAVGMLYGAVVFAVNNFATAPFLSWVRSLYLHTPVLFKPPMGWSQLVIHLFCVGLPIALVMRQYSSLRGDSR